MAQLMTNIAAGVTSGLAGVQQYERERPEREARLAEAKNRQRLSELQLQEQIGYAPLRKQQTELQLEQLQMQVQQQRALNLRAKTFESFRLYDVDKDVRHLNNFLRDAKATPEGQSLYGDYSRIDSLDSVGGDTANRLLLQAGIENPEEIKGELADNFVVATGTDGNQVLVQMDKLYAGTGYYQHMTTEKLKQISEQASLVNLLTGPQSAESKLIRDIAKEKNISLLQAAQEYKQATSRASSGTLVDRLAAEIRKNNPGVSVEDSIIQANQQLARGSADEREAQRLAGPGATDVEVQAELDKIQAEKARTTPRKQLDETAVVRDKLDEIAGGDFFSLDLTDQTNRRKVGRYITELEKLTGSELSTEDKRVARRMRDLADLGAEAGGAITDEQTGLIDSILQSFKRYTHNEVTGSTQARAAYEAFRNVFRHDLYGASLTATEIKNFEKAIGNLGQQTGPVLQQLKVAMDSLRNQLSAIYDFNDEHIAYYYLGSDVGSLDDAIERLEQRIEEVNTLGGSAPNAPRVLQSASPDERKKQLNELLKGKL